MCRAPGAKAANAIFKVFSMTRLGIKPQSTGYQVDALNRYTKRRFDYRVVLKDFAVDAEGLGLNSQAGQIGHSVANG